MDGPSAGNRSLGQYPSTLFSSEKTTQACEITGYTRGCPRSRKLENWEVAQGGTAKLLGRGFPASKEPMSPPSQ